MKNPEECRTQAKTVARAAASAAEPEEREVYESMSAQWLELAVIAEKAQRLAEA